jgi:UDP-N-acetylglucosamine 4,6-dehydratase/5-epimerase
MANKYVITGGTGTLGTAITRQLLKGDVESIRIFDNHEYSLWQMESNLKDKRLRFLVGDVRDYDRLYRAMDRVDIVIHCAALKHVPICEYNPIEAVKTNILGSINVINASIDAKVKKVLAISTDKAVSPINLYGATKLCAEKLFTQADVYSPDTTFANLRCGNFWGSNGSVVELWQNSTGTIQMTHPDMVRYFIQSDKVADIACRVIETMKGGEIFVPKMESMRLKDLARIVAPNAEWDVIGMRPGEKFTEELYTKDEEKYLYDEGDYYAIRRTVCPS